jgi:hypothetical protein
MEIEISTSTAFEMVSSVEGFGIPLSTLSGLNGTSPLAAKLAMIFLAVKAVILAWL